MIRLLPMSTIPRIPVPAASRRAHLLAASLLWTLVGIGLGSAGASWIMRSTSRVSWSLLAVASLVGLAKAQFLLRRTARRIVQRIETRGDGRCLGGFLSWKSWVIVLAMMVLGRLLRLSPLPLSLRGAALLAVGVALLAASRWIWAAWRVSLREERGPQRFEASR